MGVCDSAFNNDKENQKNNYYNRQPAQKGSNFFAAPIDSPDNDNIYVNDNSMSQTMTIDMSHYQSQKPPIMYQYINNYKTNGLQRSVAKASLVELGKGNSLLNSNLQNSGVNPNSIYSSKIEETGYESSYDGIEMIIDGKMDEDLVQKSTDINTINNYNEFIKKKDDSNGTKNNFMDYYHKVSSNSNKKSNNSNGNLKGNKEEEDTLSGIPLGNNKNTKNKNYN
jgi:hypothetical protein